jgi:hypothetical protein
MDFWTNAILFFLILIFYLHLQHEWKKGEDLEIFEMDYLSNKDLQDICKLKQPVIFQMDHWRETESLFQYVPDEKDDVVIKDIRDYYRSSKSVNGIHLSYKSAKGLCSTDPHSYFFSENNTDIVEKKDFDILSTYLEPPLMVYKKYDYWFGSANSYTPVRYHTDSGQYLTVLPGQGIRVKMCPWRFRASFSPMKDYENYEFWSKTDIWKHSPGKCLEFDVKAGYVLYIPSYWFYSIQYIHVSTEESDIYPSISSIACFQYVTAMNMIANLQHYGLYFLQQQNMVDTKARVIKPLDKEEKQETEPEPEKESKKEKEISPQVAETIAMLQPKEENNV